MASTISGAYAKSIPPAISVLGAMVIATEPGGFMLPYSRLPNNIIPAETATETQLLKLGPFVQTAAAEGI